MAPSKPPQPKQPIFSRREIIFLKRHGFELNTSGNVASIAIPGTDLCATFRRDGVFTIFPTKIVEPKMEVDPLSEKEGLVYDIPGSMIKLLEIIDKLSTEVQDPIAHRVAKVPF